MHKVEQFFLYCSGITPEILEKTPSDRNKYIGIGATVFFTGVLAFFSSGYALYTVFDSYAAAVVFGLVWGLMIFNLDRYIVMSMKSYGRWYRDLVVALPRLALAVLLALVISKPLEMKIFEKEIQGELVQMEQEVFKKQEDQVRLRYQADGLALQNEIDALKAEIGAKIAVRDTLARLAREEADGTGGSGKANLGPIYRAKKADADKAEAELNAVLTANAPIIEQKEQALFDLNATIDAEIAGLDRMKYNGLAARMEALGRLTAASENILLASIFITLLFVAIETAPVLVKLISYRSPYDYVLHEHEHVFEMANLERTTLLANRVRQATKYDTETNKHLVMARIAAEKALIDHKLREKLEELKKQPYDWKVGSV
jgi:hypothetical protein